MNNDQHLNVLITGADGFIGKNLVIRANELHNVNVLLFTRKDDIQKLKNLVKKSDVIIHLAGVNRSIDLEVFEKDNTVWVAYILVFHKQTVSMVKGNDLHTWLHKQA